MIKETNLLEEQDMARGRRKQENLTLEEQLEKLENQISEAEINLKDLKAKKKDLEAKIKEEQKEKLYKAVLQSGKSVDEIIARLYGEQEK